MAYCALQDVQDLLSGVTINSGSLPTDAQTLRLITHRSNMIDAALAARGYVVPVVPIAGTGALQSAVAAFIDELLSLNARGAAADVLFQAFPSYVEEATGTSGHPHANHMNDAFEARIVELQENVGVPMGLPLYELDTQPRSYITDIGAFGAANDTVTDAWGDLVKSEPYVRMGKKF